MTFGGLFSSYWPIIYTGLCTVGLMLVLPFWTGQPDWFVGSANHRFAATVLDTAWIVLWCFGPYLLGFDVSEFYKTAVGWTMIVVSAGTGHLFYTAFSKAEWEWKTKGLQSEA